MPPRSPSRRRVFPAMSPSAAPSPASAGFAVLVLAFAAGCNGVGRSGAVQSQLAGEIRVLEDQLYEADYTNRVLRDELERCRRRDCRSVPDRGPSVDSSGVITSMPASPPMATTDAYRPSPGETHLPAPIETYIPPPILDVGNTTVDPSLVDPPAVVLPDPRYEPTPVVDDWDLGIDLGSPVEPATPSPPEPVATPVPDGGTDSADPGSAELDPAEALDPAEPLDPPPRTPLIDPGYIPPTAPEPPDAESLREDPLVPGEVLPPPRDGRPEDDGPAGRIELPDDLNIDTDLPIEIRVHPTLTAVDGPPVEGVDGVATADRFRVVVQAIDHDGRPVDLGRFDMDAELTITMTDPSRPNGADRLGRWDFTAVQAASMVTDRPVPSINVPLKLTETLPAGEEVAVEVKLVGADETLRCVGRIDWRRQVVGGTWSRRR